MNLKKRNFGYAAAFTAAYLFANSTSALAGGAVGGNCCADLEERVAELEATTVRKGNRKVSLKISGQVNKYIMFWDDGVNDDTYIVENSTSASRFSLKGSAAISPNLSAGFILEFELANSPSELVSQTDSNGGSTVNDPLSLRKSAVYVHNRQYGRLTLGHYSPATDDIILINYGSTGAIATSDTAKWNGGFTIQGSQNAPTTLAGNTWDHVLTGSLGLDTNRTEVLRYDSPTISGFVLSAAWGEADLWDVALKWQGSLGSFKVAAGIGYLSQDGVSLNIAGVARDVDVSEIKGSASLRHIPTGIYVSGAYLDRERDIVGGGALPDSTMYYVQAGIKKRVLGLGATTFFTEYSNNQDFGTGVDFNDGGTADYTSSDVDMWGVGIVQKVNASAMEVYAVYRNYEADLVNAPGVTEEDFSAVAIGARLKF